MPKISAPTVGAHREAQPASLVRAVTRARDRVLEMVDGTLTTLVPAV